MVLGGEVLVDVAPPAYAAAAGLIPFSAAALCMPALWRTINGQTAWPGKEPDRLRHRHHRRGR